MPINYLVFYQYRDTTIPDNFSGVATVPANSRMKDSIKKNDWIQLFKSLSRDILAVFIFSADTLTRYNWEQVRNHYRILKRYDLSRGDLSLMNNEIVYQ